MPKRARSKPKTTNNLIVFSDTHCGCRLGLCPPGELPLDDGGTYKQSKFQASVWALWQEFWDEWVPMVTRGEPFDIVHNGDAIEGVHHRATTPISHNMLDQLVLAEKALMPVAQLARASGGNYYHIRGTEAHVGPSAIYEEQLARTLGAIPNADGQFARWDLWKRVGGVNGPLVHLLHHIGTTSSSAHESSAVNAELAMAFYEAGRWNREPPDFIVRSHRHRYIGIDIPTAKGRAAALVTPAWQGKTPFVWKIPGARQSEPQFGGLIIRQGDEEQFYRPRVWSLDRPKEE